MPVVQTDCTVVHMDNTATLADVINGLLEEAGMTAHGLAIEAGIPWVTLRRRLIEPGDIRIDELARIAAVLGKSAAVLLALAEKRLPIGAQS